MAAVFIRRRDILAKGAGRGSFPGYMCVLAPADPFSTATGAGLPGAWGLEVILR